MNIPTASHPTRTGYLYVLLAAMLWGLIGPIARYTFTLGISPLEVGFWRCVFAFIPFAIQAFMQGGVGIDKKSFPQLIFFGLICIALFYAALPLAIEAGGVPLAVVLLYTAPAWVIFLAWMLLKEKLTLKKVMAVGITLTGVAIISGVFEEQAHINFWAVFWGLMAGFSYSAYYIFSKTLTRHYTTPQIFFYALPLGAFVLWYFTDFTPKPATAWLALISLGVFCTWLAYALYFHGMKTAHSGPASLIATIELVVGTVISHFFWNESFTQGGYIGALLIISATFFVFWENMKQVK